MASTDSGSYDPRADPAFERVLDDVCTRLTRGEPLDHCLASAPPAYHAELRRLAPLAVQVRALAAAPDPVFVARLERQVLAGARAHGPRRRAWLAPLALPTFALRAVALALVAVLVVGGGGAGVVLAAENTLPDSPLYRVKEAREWLAVQAALSPESRTTTYLNQVQNRARELQLALNVGARPAVVGALARRFGASVEHSVDQALLARERGNPRPAQRADRALTTLLERVAQFEQQAPPGQKPILQRLHTFLAAQQARLAPPGSPPPSASA